METTDAAVSAVERARINKGWTLRKLADVLAAAGTQVDHSALAKIERGERKPRPALRKALADVLGIDPLDIPH